MGAKYTFGGRDFEPIGSVTTAERDFWVMGHVRTAGLDRAVIAPDEDPEEFALRLLREVAESGRIFPLLGGFLLPVGTKSTDWTIQMAEETAAHLRAVSDKVEKSRLAGLTAELMARFFQNGLAPLKTSRMSSVAARQTSRAGRKGAR